MSPFWPLLGLLAEVPDPRRGQGQKYKLPYVLLFSILAVVTGCNSYRGIVTFIDVNRRKLNAAFGLKWRRAPAHIAIRYILKGLDPAEAETVFRQHTTLLQAACARPGQASIALGTRLEGTRYSAGPGPGEPVIMRRQRHEESECTPPVRRSTPQAANRRTLASWSRGRLFSLRISQGDRKAVSRPLRPAPAPACALRGCRARRSPAPCART